jgi:hypothetical protein
MHMTRPLMPPGGSKPATHDTDAELTWPPPPDARFATGVLDVQTSRIISIQEAAGTPGVLDGTDDSESPAFSADSTSVRCAAEPALAAARRETGAVRRINGRRPLRWLLSARSAMTLLAALVVIQAVLIVAVLFRGRNPGISERTLQPPAAPPRTASTTPAPPPVAPVAVALADTGTADSPRPASTALSIPTEGRLLVRSDPAGASVVVDGRRRGTTPLMLEDLPPGSHRVQVGTASASLEQSVTIEAGGTTTLVVPMSGPTSAAGWISIGAPIALQIFENDRLLGSSLEGPIRLGPGTHRLQLVNGPLGYRSEQAVTIRAGEVERLRPAMPEGVLHVNAQPWANVWIDGEPAGETPLANIRVPLGHHEIRFRHPSFGEQVRQVVVSAHEPARISVSMKP